MITGNDEFVAETEDRFMKVYSDIPINLRREVVLVVEENPITWNVAYIEVKNRTKLGEIILKKLIKLDFI